MSTPTGRRPSSKSDLPAQTPEKPAASDWDHFSNASRMSKSAPLEALRPHASSDPGEEPPDEEFRPSDPRVQLEGALASAAQGLAEMAPMLAAARELSGAKE